MLRRSLYLAAAAGAGQHMQTQQKVLSIDSPLSLLRMCYRSIDITVKSRHGRSFLKKELIQQWSELKNESDPAKQRFYMDLAGSFLQALHTDRQPKPGGVVTFQLSRRVAYDKEMEEKANNPVRKVRRLKKQ